MLQQTKASFSCLLFATFACLWQCHPANAQFSDADIDFFENQIRPILVNNCYPCHSSDGESIEAGLNLGSRKSILAGGDTGPAIVAGAPKSSLLIDAVNYRGLYEMPPSSKLSAEKIGLLDEWVKRGAPWPKHDDHQEVIKKEFNLQERRESHWCWQPIKRPTIPSLPQDDWSIDKLDRFVVAKLNSASLTPAPDSDRRTWIRRVYFDLTGLPPEPEAVERFVNDQESDAYENVIDELLASNQFGERWARHWMDLTRYAETYGHEFDYPIDHAHQYRDYLIRAFNADVPYDQFIKEHVAGDLLPQPRVNSEEGFNESIIGTGFWFLGEATHAPVDVKADEAGRIDNQIDVLCKTFLGLTVACARCHDHKFDAISAADYYALSGFLQSSRRQIALLDRKQSIQSSWLSTRPILEEADVKVDEVCDKLQELDSQQWLAVLSEAATQNPDSDEEKNSSVPLGFDAIAKHKDDFKLSTHPLHILHWLDQAPAFFGLQLKQIAKDWNRDNSKFQNFVSNSELFEDFDDGIPEDWFKTGFAVESFDRGLNFSATGDAINHQGMFSTGRAGRNFQGVLRSPTFEITHDKIAIRAKGSSSLIRLIIDGYVMDVHNPLLFNGCKVEVTSENRFQWLQLKADVKNYKGHRAHLEFIDHGQGYLAVDEIRFLNNDTNPVEPASELTRMVLQQEPQDKAEWIEAAANSLHQMLQSEIYSTQHSEIASILINKSTLAMEIQQFRDDITKRQSELAEPLKIIAMMDGTAENEHLFVRGNVKSLGRKVPRQFLTALANSPEALPFSTNSGRLELAKQIANADNPLTSRVIVNRIWHHLIGAGLVRSVDNFGVLGDEPTHPELLDYLASEFTSNGWSIKSLIRRIVLSRTYRMSSQSNVNAETIDPDNRLIHRANVKRLQGETIRDSILKVAGSLDSKMYGPGVPVHLTEFMQGRGRPRANGPVDGKGRRSIYLQVRRNFLMPFMLAFDTPIPFNTIGKRHQSNVPAQALILMNDPFVVEQAVNWAARIIDKFDRPGDRIRYAIEYAFGRQATDAEIENAISFLKSQADSLQVEEWQNNKKIWNDFCHAIFNMKEFIYIK